MSFTYVMQHRCSVINLLIVNSHTVNPPSIIENAEDQVDIEEGSTVTFSIIVTGLRLTFNWMFHNGSQLSMDVKYVGQNTSVLTIYSITQQDSASYQCQVSNAAGTVISLPARLSISK